MAISGDALFGQDGTGGDVSGPLPGFELPALPLPPLGPDGRLIGPEDINPEHVNPEDVHPADAHPEDVHPSEVRPEDPLPATPGCERPLKLVRDLVWERMAASRLPTDPLIDVPAPRAAPTAAAPPPVITWTAPSTRREGEVPAPIRPESARTTPTPPHTAPPVAAPPVAAPPVAAPPVAAPPVAAPPHTAPSLVAGSHPRPPVPTAFLTGARPRVPEEPSILGFSRHSRSRLGSRLFTLFFVLVFTVIVVQTVVALLHP